jgi:integrase
MRKGQKPPNAGKRYPAQVLSRSNLDKLLTAVDENARFDDIRFRNRALITVLWRSGLRIAEALALTLADLDMEAGEIHVRKAKSTAGVRCLGIDPTAAEALELWLDHRPDVKLPWVFLSSKHGGGGGGKLAYSTVADFCKQTARQAGVEVRVHPHGFRHTFATELHREGVPVAVLSAALGHANAEITMHYAAHTLDRLEASHAMQRRAAPARGSTAAAQNRDSDDSGGRLVAVDAAQLGELTSQVAALVAVLTAQAAGA